MAAERRRGFPPVVDARTRLLILGSLPGEASLTAGQYYGNPRNAFWRLLEQVLDRPLVALPYGDRLQALLEQGVGLWDVIAEAERRGSLDAAILDPATNDLPALIETLPQLDMVAFNGATAARLGLRGLAGTGRPLETLDLPSSSPAHAAMTFEQKARIWAGLRKALA